MLNVLKNFVNSEKAVAVGVLVLAATVLVIVGKLTVVQWMEYTQVMAGIYVGGKAIQGAASAMARGKAAEAVADASTMTAAVDKLHAAIASNDAAADKALADKFKDE